MAEENTVTENQIKPAVKTPAAELIKDLFLTYAEETIVSRALAKIQDGLKPVQRAILYDMYEMGLKSNSMPKKCARIVGDVIGRFSPHGDQSAYDALVGLSQPWVKRYPLVAFTGNQGSIDGDPPAAMRYTEAKLSKIGESMLDDIRSDNVPMEPNYDGTTNQPRYLGGLFPNILCNGTQGIATGMASKLAPHYAGDVFKAIKYVLNCIPKQEKPSLDTVIRIIKAPDFPTGGVIVNPAAAVQAYRTGRGSIHVRGICHIETNKGIDSIVFTEIPYGVSKKAIIEDLANKVYNDNGDDFFKKSIADIVDKSEKGKINIVIKLKRNIAPELVLNNLFKYSKLENAFAINSTILVNGKPIENVNLLQIIECYCKHQLQTKVRTVSYNLNNYKHRLEIVNGFLKAESIIDDVIKTIRQSRNHDEVLQNLVSVHEFTENQAKAIDAKRLGSLNQLDSASLENEKNDMESRILFCEKLLTDKSELVKALISDIDDYIARGYFKNDKRRTKIAPDTYGDIADRDLIQEQDIVVFYTHKGTLKAIKADDYSTQGRGGKGSGIKLREDDFVEKVLYMSNKDDIVFITSKGKAYVLPAYKVPVVNKAATGKYLNNFVEFEDNERLMQIITIKHGDSSKQLLFVTKKGFAKRVSIEGLTIRRNGIHIIKIDDDDSVAAAVLIADNEYIMSVTHDGFALKTAVTNIRTMGRAARGNILMKFKSDDYIISAVPVTDKDNVMIVSEKGLCKRCSTDIIKERKNKGGKGVVLYKPDENTGKVAAVLQTDEESTMFVISSNNVVIRIPVKTVRDLGRTAKGVKAIKLEPDDTVVSVAMAPLENNDNDNNDNNNVNDDNKQSE